MKGAYPLLFIKKRACSFFSKYFFTKFKVLISSQTGVPVIVAEDPLTCVARGGGRALEIMDKYDIDLLSTE